MSLTKVSQTAVVRNVWIDPSKYPCKYQIRQRAIPNDKTFLPSRFVIIFVQLYVPTYSKKSLIVML